MTFFLPLYYVVLKIPLEFKTGDLIVVIMRMMLIFMANVKCQSTNTNVISSLILSSWPEHYVA